MGQGQDATSIAILETFITHFDGTFYADMARARLDELTLALQGSQKQAVAQPPDSPSTANRDFASFYIDRCNEGHIGDCDIALNLKIDAARIEAVRAKRATLVERVTNEGSNNDFASYYIERCNKGYIADCNIALNLKISPAREAAVPERRSVLCQQPKPHCP